MTYHQILERLLEKIRHLPDVNTLHGNELYRREDIPISSQGYAKNYLDGWSYNAIRQFPIRRQNKNEGVCSQIVIFRLAHELDEPTEIREILFGRRDHKNRVVMIGYMEVLGTQVNAFTITDNDRLSIAGEFNTEKQATQAVWRQSDGRELREARIEPFD